MFVHFIFLSGKFYYQCYYQNKNFFNIDIENKFVYIW